MEGMEAFKKKKGKEGTRGDKQILRENVEALAFYRNMILGVNGLYFVTMNLFGQSFFTFDIVMFVISAIIFIGCFQFMRFGVWGEVVNMSCPGSWLGQTRRRTGLWWGRAPTSTWRAAWRTT
jgi:hypothetical protein